MRRDRPKKLTYRQYEVEFSDGTKITMDAQYRAMARHYSKVFVDRVLPSMDHYRRVIRARLIKGTIGTPF